MQSRLIMATLLAAAVLSGGCADLMARSTIAPEWFQAKAVEVKGEGYPDLTEVPETRRHTLNQRQWEAEGEQLREVQAAIEARTAQDGATPSQEQIRANAAQLRAILESGAPPEAAVAPDAP